MALVVVVVVVWALLLRPQFLGGPVGYLVVSGVSMQPTLGHGDLVLTRKQASYGVGDVVAFRIPAGEAGAGSVVVHRIVGGSAANGYVTRGDNRTMPDVWRPRQPDVVGERWLRVPGGGRVLAFVRAPFALALLSALLASWLVAPGLAKSPPAARRDGEADVTTEDEPRVAAGPVEGQAGDSESSRASVTGARQVKLSQK
jgi:signal peptidase